MALKMGGYDFKTLPLSAFREFFAGDGDNMPIANAYYEVGWFGRGIDIRSDAVNRMPFDLMRGDTVIVNEEDEFQTMIDPRVNVFQLFDDMAKDLDLYGCFYAIYETNQFGVNGQWRRLVPTSITPNYDRSTGELISFTRRLGNRQMVYSVDEILYVWMPSVTSENGYGKGIGYRALQSATSLNNINKFQSKFFENGALNPTIVGIPDFAQMRDTEQARVKNALNSLMTGIKQAFKVIPMGANVTVTNLQQPLRDMAMSELSTKQREEISTALGVPQSLLFSNASNFAVATQDTLNFYDLTIVPFILMIQDQLNERLYEPNGYRLLFRWQRLEVYQALELQKAQGLNTLVGKPVMTVNEARERLGLPPIEEVVPEQPQLPPPPPPDNNMPMDSSNNPDNADDVSTDTDNVRMAKELANWKRYSMKRFKEGRTKQALQFESDILPPLLMSSIKAALEIADLDMIPSIFRDALEYLELEHA